MRDDQDGFALVVLAEFECRPDHALEFERALRHHAAASVEEEGMLVFEVANDATAPARFIVWEVFRNEEARSRHRGLSSSIAFWCLVTPMLIKQPGGKLYRERQYRRLPLARDQRWRLGTTDTA